MAKVKIAISVNVCTTIMFEWNEVQIYWSMV